ncbi:MAG: response regulator [candidate division WOR-3 bacterium]|nr:response regulator [candidate division WOR-3 bacterium]
MKTRILWIDDEIESLRSLIYYLNEEGIETDTVSNGADAVEMIKENYYDLIFLDQYMPGQDGIETLNRIREISYNLPVVMITKSEEDSVINDALSESVDDYLLKPVNPKQLIATVRKILSRKSRILSGVGKNYSSAISRINEMLENNADYRTFHKIHHILNLWNLNINRHLETDIIEMHDYQKEQINREFVRYIKEHYTDWIESGNGPALSHDFLDRFIVPSLRNNKKVFFLLIDCMRYDHYLLIETFLRDFFKTKLDFYYSIIPTATPYSRNAIFSGLTPLQINRIYPGKWDFFDTSSQNQHEEFLLNKKIRSAVNPEGISYFKISTNEALHRYESMFDRIKDNQFNALVINIMDVFTHFRSESEVLKDLLPDENSLLAFISTWFRTSGLNAFFKKLIANDYKIVISSDHGSVISKTPQKLQTGKDVSLNLKYKFGSSVKALNSDIIKISNPGEWGLPVPKKSDKWYIATGNGYLVYSTKYNYYSSKYSGTFQHGGVSMDEMIMPVGIIEARDD